MRIGAYEVIDEIARGGMGAVYRARTPDGRDVALKVLVKLDDEKRARFERECRLLASLGEADGFVPVIETGKAPEGPFLVMPLIRGGTLRRRLELGPMSSEETARLGRILARALGRAHALGIVHRDMKPENILFTERGEPLIADLGLAKHFDQRAKGSSQTIDISVHGAFRGTAGYMAPEQMEDARSVGPEADVFALGAILYECVAGQPAFSGKNLIEVVTNVTNGSRPSLVRPDVPPRLAAAIERALALDPRERFADGRAFARALEKPPRLVAPFVAGALLLGIAAGRLLVPHSPDDGRAAPDAPAPPPLPSPPSVVISATPSDGGEVPLLCQRGEAKRKSHDPDGAIADFTRAIELDSRCLTAWHCRGLAKADKGGDDGAIADYSRALEIDPSHVPSWYSRGISKVRKGDHASAIDDFTRVLGLDAKHMRAWYQRGCARSKMLELIPAIGDFTQALELDPTYVSSWVYRGTARRDSGDLDGAIADFTKALALDQKQYLAFYGRGHARRARNDLAGAIADFTGAIEVEPQRSGPFHFRGACKAKLGRVEEAIEDFTREIAIDPNHAASYYERAELRRKKGDGALAIADYEQFLRLATEGPSAQAARQRLAELKAKKGAGR